MELDSDSSLEITLLYSDSDAEDTFYNASSTFAMDSTDDKTTEAVRQKADPATGAGRISNCADELTDHLSHIHICDRTQSEATDILHDQPGSRVHATLKQKRRHRKGPKFYVVFLGQTMGICEEWSVCESWMSGIPHMLHKSYMTRAAAVSAYAYALSRGWVQRWQGHSLTSLQAARMVMPKPEDALTRPAQAYQTPLNNRQAVEAWHVIYKGICPGIYPTYIEAGLNILGITNAVHEVFESLQVACDKFKYALDKGQVKALLPPPVA
ncbi:hypothetical protein EV421DRAFT_1732617 [Armillaria borealis]|uniref:Ribonuclease H1 N-terminal domain-containing protein n=1 Tax=Armillaria borealis TaxID=47425 RepID=A0AA39MXD2_9AGAR|nr:hypothetical protein EV421DRAFT_1732617 [Armillaria borealis]